MTPGRDPSRQNPKSGLPRGSKSSSVADALIPWLQTLVLSGGDRDGELLEVLEWQRAFLADALAPGVREAALSVARGNGKSALVAALATAVVHPEGPLHGNRREVVVVASSFAQGRIVFDDVLAFLGREVRERGRGFRLQDSAQAASVEWTATGARVRCLGSDPGRLHGLRPWLVLADEPAQWPHGLADRMIAALRTSLGKSPEARIITLGTRPADSGHWFARALEGEHSHCYAAAADADPLSDEAVAAANPSLDHLPSLRAQLNAEREHARMDAGALATWRALRLNLGVLDTDEPVLLEAADYQAAEGIEAACEGSAVWGVDLGSSEAQSAVAAYWPATGRLEAIAAFPGVPGLVDRGRKDNAGNLYLDCVRSGDLLILGDATVDVSALIRAALDRWGAPAAVAADRWRNPELRFALATAGVPKAAFELRGMGWKDGAEDVRLFRKAFLDGAVKPRQSLLLRSAFAEARTVTDSAGNVKLAKSTQGGRRVTARDDAAAAAILAVALGVRRGRKPAQPRRRWAIVGQ